MRSDLSGEVKSAGECLEGHGIHSQVAMGNKVVCNYIGASEPGDVWRRKSLAVFTESLELEKEITITWEPAELALFLKPLDNENLLILASFCRVMHVNIMTGVVSAFSNSEKFRPIDVDVFPGSQNIFAARATEVKLLTLDWKAMRVISRTVVELDFDAVLNICAVGDDRVFVLTTYGYYEMWKIGKRNDCICRGRIDDNPSDPKYLPLTQDEERQETLRFRREIESYVFQVPREILGIVARFI